MFSPHNNTYLQIIHKQHYIKYKEALLFSAPVSRPRSSSAFHYEAHFYLSAICCMKSLLIRICAT